MVKVKGIKLKLKLATVVVEWSCPRNPTCRHNPRCEPLITRDSPAMDTELKRSDRDIEPTDLSCILSASISQPQMLPHYKRLMVRQTSDAGRM